MPRKHVNREKLPNADAGARPAEIPDQTETGMCGRCTTFGADASQPGRILVRRPAPEQLGVKAIGYKPVAELRRSGYRPVGISPAEPLEPTRCHSAMILAARPSSAEPRSTLVGIRTSDGRNDQMQRTAPGSLSIDARRNPPFVASEIPGHLLSR